MQLIDSLHWGGAQKLLLTFAEAVQGKEISLTVLSLAEHRRDVSLPLDLSGRGARVVVMSAPYLFHLERFARLRRFLQDEKVDVLHTHLTYANILGALAGKWAGVPVVASLHNESFNPRRDNRLRRWMETRTLRFGATRLIAVGYAVEQTQRDRFHGKRMEVILNAVTPIPPLPEDRRTVLRASLTGEAARPLLISVGRLSRQKAFEDLLAAFVQVRQKYPRAALVIVGGGSAHNELTAQIHALGLEGHAHLLGFRNDVPALLAAGDLFVNSSHWEGVPISILEAMSAGLPVVATGVGDVPKVIGEGAGLIVPPAQPAQLAEAISSLLDNPARRQAMGAAAKTHALQHYSQAVWAERLLTVYREVANQ